MQKKKKKRRVRGKEKEILCERKRQYDALMQKKQMKDWKGNVKKEKTNKKRRKITEEKTV